MIRLSFIFMLCLYLSGCSAGIESGSVSSSSVCGGPGEAVAPPKVPFSVGSKVQIHFSEIIKPKNSFNLLDTAKHFFMHSLNLAEAIIPKGTDLDVLVNHECTSHMRFSYAPQTMAPFISEAVMTPAMIPIQRAKQQFRQHHHSWHTPYDMRPSELVDMIENDPCIISVSNNPQAYPQHTPNDSSLSNQAYLNVIKAPAAWDTFYGASGITGDVIVAVIDDGTQIDHSDLTAQIWTNTAETASNATDDDGNGYVDDVNGYNFVDATGDPSQLGGKSHGTHVAGTIAATENNSIGIAGVMGRHIKIMALNVFGSNAGAGANDINNAINYAVSKGANVINMSLGGQGSSASTNTALQNAVAAGVTVIIAAGNSSQEITASNFWYPVGYAKDIDGVIGIGSIDASTLNLSSFSNYSTTYVELAAPGSDSSKGGIYSTIPTSSYGYKQGTSMASPVVTGAAALAYGLYTSRGYTVLPSRIESVLLDSASTLSQLSSSIKNSKNLDLESLASLITNCP